MLDSKKIVTVVGFGQVGRTIHSSLKKKFKVNICRRTSDYKSIFKSSDYVILCLPDNPGKFIKKIIPYTPSKCIFINHTTCDPKEYNNLNKDIMLLDCPITKSNNGLPYITMVGGQQQLLTRCKSLLKNYCQEILYMGVLGSGQKAKAVNQLCLINAFRGVVGAVKLAKKLKLPMVKIKNMLNNGGAHSIQLKKFNNINKGHYESKFIGKETAIIRRLQK